ncbi:hypothetical protein HDK64DRAFT_299011 [Phyllosticta capitalensis]
MPKRAPSSSAAASTLLAFLGRHDAMLNARSPPHADHPGIVVSLPYSLGITNEPAAPRRLASRRTVGGIHRLAVMKATGTSHWGKCLETKHDNQGNNAAPSPPLLRY